MRPRPMLLALLVAGLLATACTSGSRGAQGAAPIRPPTLVSSARPEWRYPPVPREGRVLDMRVEVQIDSAGWPDFGTLRVTGLGAAENRDAVETWLRSARFRPAEQAGRPVPGVFQTHIDVRAQIRRVG